MKCSRFTNYHIVGDLISSHMYGSRRFKLDGVGFGTSFPHELERLNAQKWKEYTATEEDEEYLEWSRRATSVPDHLLFVPRLAEHVFIRNLGETVPIPGSERGRFY